MDKFELLHKYNTLVRRDMAPALRCERDGMEYVVRYNDGTNPILKCYSCGGIVTPGEKMYNELQEIVEETLR